MIRNENEVLKIGGGTYNPPNMAKIQAFVGKQKRVKGYPLGVQVGSNSFRIELSGDAKLFLGFSLRWDEETISVPDLPPSISLTINNDIVIDRIHPKFFNGAYISNEFYEFPRPLSGRDNIVLTMDGIANINIYSAFYYI